MRPRSRGFTLIELLVAVTIMAIVAVMGWRGLDTIVRARMTLNGALDQTRGLQLAFAQMQSDCSHVVSQHTLPSRAPIVVEPERLVMVRTVFGDNQASKLQVVAYQLKSGVLTRRESSSTRDLNILDSLWSSISIDTSVPTVQLQSGVASMAIRVWLNDGAGWRTPGSDVTPPTQTTSNAAAAVATPIVPTGLEVTLKMRDGNKMTKVFLLGAV
jgi:general secretion pathway protein J